MPRRPVQHQISDKAVAKVRDVWASIGAAVEEIRQDYGEDLLVQTCFEDRMDSSRIWVQVKGVTNALLMRTHGKVQVRVESDLALRWARSADILVLILWDIENNIGWYSIPTYSELHDKLASPYPRKTPLSIDSSNIFNSESAQLIAWKARMEHLTRFVRNLRSMQEEDFDDDDPDRGLWAGRAATEAAIDMMVDLNIVNLKGNRTLQNFIINPDFKKIVVDTAEEMGKAAANEAEEYVTELIVTSLLKQIGKETGWGASVAVLAEMAKTVHVMLDLNQLEVFIKSRPPTT